MSMKGGLGDLMKQAQQMQEKMQSMQNEILDLYLILKHHFPCPKSILFQTLSHQSLQLLSYVFLGVFFLS